MSQYVVWCQPPSGLEASIPEGPVEGDDGKPVVFEELIEAHVSCEAFIDLLGPFYSVKPWGQA